MKTTTTNCCKMQTLARSVTSIFLGWAAAVLCPESVIAQSTQAVVLLKNDRVLEGDVEKQGDSFAIKIATASRVMLPKDQVQYIGTSKLDLYQYKLRGILKPSAGDHFKLSRWCMVNGLLDQAVIHYLEAAAWNGENPSIKRLAVELKEQLLKVPEFREYLGLPDESTGVRTSVVSLAVARTGTGEAGGGVQQAGGVQELPPQEVVAVFGERIQPILLNRCSQAACHGGQTKTPLRIIEPHARFGPQTNTNNLKSVLAYVPERDGISPLIGYATRAHGLQRRPGVELAESQLLEELRNWVALVQNPVVPGHDVSSSGSAPLQSFDSLRSIGSPEGRGSSLSPVVRGNEPRPVPNSSNNPAAAPSQDATRASTLDQWRSPAVVPNSGANGADHEALAPNAAPVREPTVVLPGTASSGDPFDPKAFNLRMHGPSPKP